MGRRRQEGTLVSTNALEGTIPSLSLSITQQKDLICLGHLILSLALMSPVAAHADNFVNSVDMIKANYSIDIQNLVQ